MQRALTRRTAVPGRRMVMMVMRTTMMMMMMMSTSQPYGDRVGEGMVY